jgi:hypothetical protein
MIFDPGTPMWYCSYFRLRDYTKREYRHDTGPSDIPVYIIQS